jgi:hypothetical protein
MLGEDEGMGWYMADRKYKGTATRKRAEVNLMKELKQSESCIRGTQHFNEKAGSFNK